MSVDREKVRIIDSQIAALEAWLIGGDGRGLQGQMGMRDRTPKHKHTRPGWSMICPELQAHHVNINDVHLMTVDTDGNMKKLTYDWDTDWTTHA